MCSIAKKFHVISNTCLFEICRSVLNFVHVNFTCTAAMLVLLMHHEDGVTFTDIVCIEIFSAILQFVLVISVGNRHAHSHPNPAVLLDSLFELN